MLPIAFLLGSDSFIASTALGAIRTSTMTRVRLALLFGLADGFAGLAGCALAAGFGTAWLEAATLLATIALPAAIASAVLVVATTRDPSRLAAGPAALILPLLLSVDNLVAPATVSPGAALATAVSAALASGALAFAGLAAGGLLRRAIRSAASGRLVPA